MAQATDHRGNPGLDDLRIKFEQDETGAVHMYHTDRNGNLVHIGELTHTGATRLIGRIANVSHLDVVIRQRAR